VRRPGAGSDEHDVRRIDVADAGEGDLAAIIGVLRERLDPLPWTKTSDATPVSASTAWTSSVLSISGAATRSDGDGRELGQGAAGGIAVVVEDVAAENGVLITAEGVF